VRGQGSEPPRRETLPTPRLELYLEEDFASPTPQPDRTRGAPLRFCLVAEECRPEKPIGGGSTLAQLDRSVKSIDGGRPVAIAVMSDSQLCSSKRTARVPTRRPSVPIERPRRRHRPARAGGKLAPMPGCQMDRPARCDSDDHRAVAAQPLHRMFDKTRAPRLNRLVV
jgi:hypothetical protein